MSDPTVGAQSIYDWFTTQARKCREAASKQIDKAEDFEQKAAQAFSVKDALSRFTEKFGPYEQLNLPLWVQHTGRPPLAAVPDLEPEHVHAWEARTDTHTDEDSGEETEHQVWFCALDGCEAECLFDPEHEHDYQVINDEDGTVLFEGRACTICAKMEPEVEPEMSEDLVVCDSCARATHFKDATTPDEDGLRFCPECVEDIEGATETATDAPETSPDDSDEQSAPDEVNASEGPTACSHCGRPTGNGIVLDADGWCPFCVRDPLGSKTAYEEAQAAIASGEHLPDVTSTRETVTPMRRRGRQRTAEVLTEAVAW